MGQLLLKFKEWREKLELSHEKAKHGKYILYHLLFTVCKSAGQQNSIVHSKLSFHFGIKQLEFESYRLTRIFDSD